MKASRRTFLKTVGGIGLFSIVPRNVLGGNGFVAPSDQLTKGIIGVGGIGRSSYHFTSSKECRLVSVCDVDNNHLQSAVKAAKERFGEDVKAYHDFRELITDPNVDVVHIATPPHWHAIMAIEAAKAGKDIWCEKPMTRTIGEGKRVVEAMKRYNRVFRLNTWFRFTDTFYGLGTTVEPLKKLVASGMLGWPLKVVVSGSTGFTWKFFWVGKENLQPQPVPKELDYDMWLGPAPFKPYNQHRTHQTFRGYWDYDGGGLTDMGQHRDTAVRGHTGRGCFIVAVDTGKPLTVIGKIAVDVAVLRNCTVKLNARCYLKHGSAVSADAIQDFLPSFARERNKLSESRAVILDKTHERNNLGLLIPLNAESHVVGKCKNIVICGIISFNGVCNARCAVAYIGVAMKLGFVSIPTVPIDRFIGV